MTSTTLHSTPYPRDQIFVTESPTYPRHVYLETREVEEMDDGLTSVSGIVVTADALRDAIDKAVPQEPKPFDIEAQLAESWERAEQGVAKTGDLLIAFENGSHGVWTSTMDYHREDSHIRIVKRAPKPEPVQMYVNPDRADDFYLNIGPTRYMSGKGHRDQQEATLIRDGYVPAKVVAL